MNKLKEILFKKKLNTVKLAELTGIDRVIISFVVNGKALFVPKDMLKVSDVLKTPPNKIWKKKDVYIKETDFSPYKPKTEEIGRVYKQIHFRAVTECYSDLMTKENLNLCGYKSLQDWGMDCMKKFQRKVERVKKEKALWYYK